MNENIAKSENEKPRNFFSRMPKAVPFILCSIFFERYTSGGIAGKRFIYTIVQRISSRHWKKFQQQCRCFFIRNWATIPACQLRYFTLTRCALWQWPLSELSSLINGWDYTKLSCRCRSFTHWELLFSQLEIWSHWTFHCRKFSEYPWMKQLLLSIHNLERLRWLDCWLECLALVLSKATVIPSPQINTNFQSKLQNLHSIFRYNTFAWRAGPSSVGFLIQCNINQNICLK